MNKVQEALARHELGETDIEVLEQCGSRPAKYDLARQVFNRRFSFYPWAIAFPETTEHVAQLVQLAHKARLKIRVQGGRHDHEGECSANDALVIDMRKMRSFRVVEEQGFKIACIGAGWEFRRLIVQLVNAGVSIPHGTCQTVGITGFTLGGGWGPWTRKYGMCCEHLVAATLVLGDGSWRRIHESSENPEDRDLLWALRGGGGFSYGIVTELEIRTFDLPAKAHKFTASWTSGKTPAVSILKGWEQAIAGDQNEHLVGTNLKIFANPRKKNPVPVTESFHECHFYGYWVGPDDDLEQTVRRWFPGCEPDDIAITADRKNSHLQFSTWGRVLASRQRPGSRLAANLDPEEEFPLEEDRPAPHRITSRLVDQGGLKKKGRRRLIETLESDLLSKKGAKHHVWAYVTLGAISGPFYDDYEHNQPAIGAAFPYQDRAYTIQYQVWWDADSFVKTAIAEATGVKRYTNRAMDWLEECRDAHIPHTSGAFISFKDAAIPTKTYFMQNYKRLIKIKRRYSRDRLNRFRSRKTIL